jgi:hypothetical protein
MHSRGQLWALLAVSYITVLEVAFLLWMGQLTVSVESALKALLIPTVQTAVLLTLHAVVAVSRPADGRRLEAFLASALLLALSLFVVNAGVELLIARRMNLTDHAVFLLLAVPTAQAAAITHPRRAASRLLERSRAVVSNAVLRPIIWLDVMILAGVLALHDRWFGGPDGALMFQRRWMGIKLLAAAALTGWLVIRRQQAAQWTHARGTLIFAAILLAALGLDGLRPWIYAVADGTTRVVAPPVALIVRAAVYAMLIGLMLTSSLQLRKAMATVEARSLIGGGVAVLFFAALALFMNGFLSPRPVAPWAAIATTSGSVAGSLFLLGVALAATSGGQPDRS